MSRHIIENNSNQLIEKEGGKLFRMSEPFWVYKKKTNPVWEDDKEFIDAFKTRKDAEDYIQWAEALNKKEDK